VDFFHLSETGNEMVAKLIVADVVGRGGSQDGGR
jgi:hypothetical protein